MPQFASKCDVLEQQQFIIPDDSIGSTSAGLAWSPSCDCAQMMAGRALLVQAASLTHSELGCRLELGLPCHPQWYMPRRALWEGVLPEERSRRYSLSGPGLQNPPGVTSATYIRCSRQVTKLVHSCGDGEVLNFLREEQPPRYRTKGHVGWEILLHPSLGKCITYGIYFNSTFCLSLKNKTKTDLGILTLHTTTLMNSLINSNDSSVHSFEFSTYIIVTFEKKKNFFSFQSSKLFFFFFFFNCTNWDLQ